MPNDELADLCIWMTRPEGQQHSLQTLIQSYGGSVHHQALIQIESLAETSEGYLKLNHSDNYDLIIFISQNAVRAALQNRDFTCASRTKIGAIGAATAKCIKGYGLRVDLVPEKDFDSESFLNLLSEDDVQGKKILIVRGIGGRDYLFTKLSQRGAQVEYAEIYKRVNADVNLSSIFNDNRVIPIKLIVITSKHALFNLVAMAKAQSFDEIFDTKLLLIHPRLQKHCAELGFSQTPLIAEQASDDAIVEQIRQWVRKNANTIH